MAARRLDVHTDRRTERILKTLDGINVEKELNRFRSVLGGKTSWVVTDDRRYMEWKESKTPGTFHVSGNKGMGKGNIAIAVVDDLNSYVDTDHPEDDSPGFAYFFCNAQTSEANRAIMVLRALVHQLLTKKKLPGYPFLHRRDAEA